jgi:hypothetical protein
VPKKSRSGVILECYRRAAEARRMADGATNRPGCPWPAALRPKRSRRCRAGFRNPSTNSEVVAETAALGGPPDSRTDGNAVADMQHCRPNVTRSVSILHSVSEPRHRVQEGEAMTPRCVRFHHERVRL